MQGTLETWDRKSWIGLWLIVAVAALGVGWARGLGWEAGNLHGFLAALFAGGAVALVGLDIYLHCEISEFSWRSLSAQLGLMAPRTRVGYRVCLLYFMVTMGAFMLSHSGLWQHRLPLLLAERVTDSGILWVAVAAPLYEEIFFRGALQSIVSARLGQSRTSSRAQWWAVYVTALVFWLFHVPWDGAIWQAAIAAGGLPLSPGPFLVGLACGAVVVIDRSLVMAVILHGLANFVGPLWAFVLPGAVIPWFFAG